jgi:CMP-N-acetylneuraminic acid synthetase
LDKTVNLCYIQARAGSKRFPGKNIALWKGKPMVADAIEKAKATGLFDIIAVSSDSPEILQIAHDYGVLPLWRTPEASSDTATDDDVASEVLSYFPNADIVCKLYPCIPLFPLHRFEAAYEFLKYMPNTHGVYFSDNKGIDSGSMYMFRASTYKQMKSIKLDAFPWTRSVMLDEWCQDINTPKDLEIAKQKAGL